jgi:hypothetical protein
MNPVGSWHTTALTRSTRNRFTPERTPSFAHCRDRCNTIGVHGQKLCINGHEYLKRQLAKRGVAFEALDNGIKSCANPQVLQKLSDGLTAEKIDRLLRKWLRRSPHPFPSRDRAAGYRYQLSPRHIQE